MEINLDVESLVESIKHSDDESDITYLACSVFYDALMRKNTRVDIQKMVEELFFVCDYWPEVEERFIIFADIFLEKLKEKEDQDEYD